MNKRPHPAKGPHRHRRKKRGDGQARPEPELLSKQPRPPVLKNYGAVFYETHALAREDVVRLAELKSSFDQLNIIIRSEGTMDDPDLLKFGKIYAGEAWTLIHKRRVDEGWYNEPRE